MVNELALTMLKSLQIWEQKQKKCNHDYFTMISTMPHHHHQFQHFNFHTYSFRVAFDPASGAAYCVVVASVHPCDRYLVAMVSVVSALFVVANVHQVSYENEVRAQQMMERHYRNVVRHRLSGIGNVD